MAQITSLYETFGAKHFFIVDDLFGQDRLETLRFCRLLRDYQIGIKKRFELTVQIRLDKAKDTEMLQAMREAGVDVVAIGFESPIPEELKAMDKHLKPEDMISLSRVFYQAGFLIHGMFIFGYPFEKEVPHPDTGPRTGATFPEIHQTGQDRHGPGFAAGPHTRYKADPEAQAGEPALSQRESRVGVL